MPKSTADISLPEDVGVVRALNVYPIKSCGAVPVPILVTNSRGVDFDRQWMIVQCATAGQDEDQDLHSRKWRFVTQRQHPKLALVNVEIKGLTNALENAKKDGKDYALSFYSESERELHAAELLMERFDHGDYECEMLLRVDDSVCSIHSSLASPVSPTRILNCKVWDSDVLAMDEGETAAKFISKFLLGDSYDSSVRHSPFRLVRQLPVGHDSRCVLNKFLDPDDDSAAPEVQVNLSDSAPLLVMNLETIHELNSTSFEPQNMKIRMDRFRPNVIVDDFRAFDEDHWKKARIEARKLTSSSEFLSNTDLEAVCLCIRCKTTTVNQQQGVADENGEPLKTLRASRMKGKLGPFLGTKMRHCRDCSEHTGAQEPPGLQRSIIAVGDRIRVLERQSNPNWHGYEWKLERRVSVNIEESALRRKLMPATMGFWVQAGIVLTFVLAFFAAFLWEVFHEKLTQ